jgi:hypothetical protein
VCDIERFRKRKQQVNVVRDTSCGNKDHPVFPRYAAHVWKKAVLQFRRDERPSFFRAENTMHQLAHV